jgi:two-component system, chemotaxis family, CheB/CheR fusion protein
LFDVVGIGNSADGLDALREFFSVMPADSGAAFRSDPASRPEPREPYIAAILAKSIAMNVVEAQDGMPLEADSIYTIPPKQTLRKRRR